MKRIAILLLLGITLAGGTAIAQPVLVKGELQAVKETSRVKIETALPLPMSQTLVAGKTGVVLSYPDGSRIRISAGSEFVLAGGAPPRPAMDAPVESPDATSALKSILTRRDMERFRQQSQKDVAHDMVTLRTGALMADEKAAPLEIRVLGSLVRAAYANFSVTVASPLEARVTVASGEISLSSPGSPARNVAQGEFAVVSLDENCTAVAEGPQKIPENALAQADMASLRNNQANGLAQSGDSKKALEPVGEQVGAIPSSFLQLPSVGTGPSVPFDLANPRTENQTRSIGILLLPNTANTGGAVQSPEHP